MILYFIRHGRQSSGLCNVDVSLSEEGRRQAVLVGERLSSYNIDALYTSNLIRAKETAAIIGEKICRKPIEIENIEEIHFGDWQGKSDEYLNTVYQQMKSEHERGIRDVTYPGGENGEMCHARFRKGMQEIVSKDYESVAVVTHGVALRAFLVGELGMDYAQRGIFVKSFENCSITQVIYEKETDRYMLERLNDFAHLEPYDELLRKHFKQK